MDANNLTNIPNYEAILKEIVNKLSQRSGLIAKRTLLISWPGMIYVGILTFLGKSEDKDMQDLMLNFVLIVTPLVLLYVVIFTHLFLIEKILWIDSYFDKKNINSEQSWKIAKKLFWPALLMRIQIFIRYYLFPIIFLFTPLIYFFYLLFRLISASLSMDGTFEITNVDWLLLACSFILLPLLTWIYFYYLKIKLRYVWFIFLDSFGQSDFSHVQVLKKMNELNNVCKSDTFKKSLAINLGTDAVKGINDFTISQALMPLINLGKGGEVAGNVIKIYGSELTNNLASFSKIAGNYMLYSFAQHANSGETQRANENIYKLSE